MSIAAVPAYEREAADRFCLSPYAALALLAGTPWRRLVVLGDSVAEGVSEPLDGYRDEPWAGRVAAALRASRPEFAYLNLGRRNLLVAEVRAQQLERALAFAPDLAIVVAGGNDMLRRSFDPGAVEADLAAIVGALRDRGADVATYGLLDISRAPHVPGRFRDGLRARRDELARHTAAVSARHGGLHIDLGPHPTASDADLWSSDGIHANARGHAIVAAETIRALAAWWQTKAVADAAA